MLDHLKRHWRSWLIGSIIILFFTGVVIFSDAFQQCINKPDYESADHEPKKGISQVISPLGWTETCAGEFLKEDSEALTAFFTIVLAVSTIALWASTKEAARGAERSAKIAEDALTVLERPWIFVHLSPKLERRPEPPRPSNGIVYPTVRITDPEDEIPLAVFDIANHGKMPAIIDGCWIHLGRTEITTDGPEIETGMIREQFHGAIGPGERKEHLFVDCPAGRAYGIEIDIITETSHPVPIIGSDEIFVFSILIHYFDVSRKWHISQ